MKLTEKDFINTNPKISSYDLKCTGGERDEILKNQEDAEKYKELPKSLVDRKLIPDMKLEFKENIRLRKLEERLKKRIEEAWNDDDFKHELQKILGEKQ